jgi:CDGSH-type Zn-finger protein
MYDGPIIIKGDFILKYGDNDREMKGGLISLCRCGSSNQMPFCDGTHRKIGFEDV